jgi:transposase
VSKVEDASASLPHLRDLRVDRVFLKGAGVRIEAGTTSAHAPCPGCGTRSGRVHSRYPRRLADTGIGGRQVLLVLTVRRFFCDQPGCERKTFVEQVPGLTTRHGRHTGPADHVMATVAMALGGRAGARLADRLAVPVSRTTLLRVIRRVPDPPVLTPRALGVDEFAQRRGHRYATILIDMETHRPVDVLPDRDADTLAGWLREHPGVQIVCRDRCGAYADGAARGAPDAVQVADRWHLMHNLSEAVQKVVTRHRRCLQRPSDAPAAPAPPPSSKPGRRATNTRQRHAAVHALLAKGAAINAVARQLQLDRKTVRKYARAGDAERLLGPNPSSGPGLLGPFKPYLQTRCDEGVTATGVLYEEIRARGYRGSIRTLRRFLANVRVHERVPTPPPVPSARQITGWIMRPDDTFTDEDRTGLKDACARCPELAELTDLAHGFTNLVRQREGDRLETWINNAARSPFSELRGFGTGLRSDFDAVRAGLTLPWSSGAVEGAINRVKMIKRQMYGRARLDLLRKRVLAPP